MQKTKLSPHQRQVLAQIADLSADGGATPVFPLQTIKALMSRRFIRRSHIGQELRAGSSAIGLGDEQFVITATGRAALAEAS